MALVAWPPHVEVWGQQRVWPGPALPRGVALPVATSNCGSHGALLPWGCVILGCDRGSCVWFTLCFKLRPIYLSSGVWILAGL